jgi:biotin carboxyl carrier protein
MAYEEIRIHYPHTGIPSMRVREGQEVRKGDVLAVLNRLEIPDEIKAPHDGLVTEVNLEPVNRFTECGEHVLTLRYELTQEEQQARKEEKHYRFIKAPWDATYYLKPDPRADPIISIGDYIRKGQDVCVAMIAKQVRTVQSDLEGTIERIYFNHGQDMARGERLLGVRRR